MVRYTRIYTLSNCNGDTCAYDRTDGKEAGCAEGADHGEPRPAHRHGQPDVGAVGLVPDGEGGRHIRDALCAGEHPQGGKGHDAAACACAGTAQAVVGGQLEGAPRAKRDIGGTVAGRRRQEGGKEWQCPRRHACPYLGGQPAEVALAERAENSHAV